MMLVIVSVSAEDTGPIIPEGNLSIQMITTKGFQYWPGTSGYGPVDAAAGDGRIWLIWPEMLISLTPAGGADDSTLLSMFASATADWNGGSWTPENGVVGADGFWRGFSQDGKAFLELNTVSGEVKKRPWIRPLPMSVQPGTESGVWTFSPDRISLIRTADDPSLDPLFILPFSSLPTATGWTFSKTENRVAWFDAQDGSLNWADLDSDYRITAPQKHRFAGGRDITPQGITWAGNLLIVAYPGKLAVISAGDVGGRAEQLLVNPQIPPRWYSIAGGDDFLLVHSPETGSLAALGVKQGFRQPAITYDFPQLLRTKALEAGDRLESAGYPDSAERFYGWILPEVRAMRSHQPMDEFWPGLEAELTRRRSLLREKY
jgi:hypothetical protein